jgi:hypothetical protein
MKDNPFGLLSHVADVIPGTQALSDAIMQIHHEPEASETFLAYYESRLLYRLGFFQGQSQVRLPSGFQVFVTVE